MLSNLELKNSMINYRPITNLVSANNLFTYFALR